ncbi:KRAB-A domain-containing protein 2-like [Aphis craccivora]|uniref:KRAB-A domain-containing protein 2-like n=1 Tax=Aphis craccivora TaxID=307492 RepID=A0A6G0YA25_APHCR|nr:KRAB-A domain-containing protein 2-like [Aphis craccivora]
MARLGYYYKWSVRLKFVQFQKNSSHHRIKGRSSYKALFGCDPKVGLSTFNLPLEVIKKLTTEEDLEEIYNKYENENIEQGILERKAGHNGQEKATEKSCHIAYESAMK